MEALTKVSPTKAYIHRIEVVNVKKVPIIVQGSHAGLKEDRTWGESSPTRRGRTAKSGEAVLYQREGEDDDYERPFAFLSGGKDWYLEVEVQQISSEYRSNPCWCTIQDEDTSFSHICRHKEVVSSRTAAVTDTKAVFRFDFDGKIPFGLWGKFSFHIWMESTDLWSNISRQRTEVIEDSIPLELYCISVSDLPRILEGGIRLLLLRMYMLPMRERMSNYTPEVWIELVTRISFGTASPFTGEDKKTTDHWLYYESYYGNPSFTTKWGGAGLNLDAWLDSYRNWKEHKVYTTVNCYDQAAITEVALCLGLHHQQIHWEFHQVYGFFGGELVGCGTTNNPYFAGDESKRILTALFGVHPERYPFRNHAYLSWSAEPFSEDYYDSFDKAMEGCETRQDYVIAAEEWEAKKGVQMFMIDACGGPCVGIQSRQDYERAVGKVGVPADSENYRIKQSFADTPGKWEEEHHLGAGVSSTEPAKMIPMGSVNQKMFESEQIRIAKIISAGHYKSLPSVGPDVSAYKQHFRDQITKRLQPRVKAGLKECFIKSYTTKDGISVEEVKLYFSVISSRLHQSASMQIVTSNDALKTQAALVEQLAREVVSIGHSDRLVDIRTIKYENYGSPEVGTGNSRAIIFGSTTVKISVNDWTFWKTESDIMYEMFSKFIDLVEARSG